MRSPRWFRPVNSRHRSTETGRVMADSRIAPVASDDPRPCGNPAAASDPAGAGSAGHRWSVGAVLGVASGLAPHLLHHAGLLTGAALLAGIGGTVVSGAFGLAVMA